MPPQKIQVHIPSFELSDFFSAYLTNDLTKVRHDVKKTYDMNRTSGSF